MASAVVAMVTGRPSKEISPVSAVSAPESTLISVDFPAPFSPTRAWTSPTSTDRSALRIARTAPNRLATPRTASRTAAARSSDGGAAAPGDPGSGVSLIVCLSARGPGTAGDAGRPRARQ